MTSHGNQEGITCERILGSITRPELEQVQSDVLEPLNAAIAGAADSHNWDDVGGVAELFRDHGYCADLAAWVTTLTRSVAALGGRLQARFLGTLQPNEAGHDATGELIAAPLERSFFPAQLLPARVVSQQQQADDGGPSDIALVAIGAGGALLLTACVWFVSRRRGAAR